MHAVVPHHGGATGSGVCSRGAEEEDIGSCPHLSKQYEGEYRESDGNHGEASAGPLKDDKHADLLWSQGITVRGSDHPSGGFVDGFHDSRITGVRMVNMLWVK